MNRLHKTLLESGNKPLLGAAMYFYDPVFLEIAAHAGFKVIWIEMEHAPITFAEAADLCRMARGSGMLSMIRIPDTRRENVLKAAECGPDIIDVPMANSPESLKELVTYAKFAPEGTRGFFSVSRALNYGIVESVPNAQQQLNRDLCLMAQVETIEAVGRIEELCAIPGVDIFIGPADLAASLGLPGQTSHPKVIEAARHAIDIAKSQGKKIATACAPDDFIIWLRLGVDLLFCTNDIACLKAGACGALKLAEQAIGQLERDGGRAIPSVGIR
jgi:4-hydroxy-2-oxoheptanedioate aldolase